MSGVPQGSVLGPILFLIYINDIVDNLNCNAYLFADDMKIYNGIPDDKYNNLFKLQSHLDLRKNSFTVRVVPKWNSLPADVVKAPSVDAFRNRLDKFWFNQEVRFNYKAQFDY